MLIALTFHAELLFDEKVWTRVRQVLRWLRHYSAHATFFTMAPYHERCRPKDEDVWLDRLRFIEQEGHRVGLHTHFYRDDCGGEISFSKERVSFLIQRDVSYFRQRGFKVTGFAGGGWILDPNVCTALLQNEFTHDCTAHMFKVGYARSRGHHVLATRPFWVREDERSLLEMPTSASVSSTARNWLKNFRTPVIKIRNVEYYLVYLHDYDLLRPVMRCFFLCIVVWQALCKCQFVTTPQLRAILQNEDLEIWPVEEIGKQCR